jgi:hypothetical protein
LPDQPWRHSVENIRLFTHSLADYPGELIARIAPNENGIRINGEAQKSYFNNLLANALDLDRFIALR